MNCTLFAFMGFMVAMPFFCLVGEALNSKAITKVAISKMKTNIILPCDYFFVYSFTIMRQ